MGFRQTLQQTGNKNVTTLTKSQAGHWGACFYIIARTRTRRVVTMYTCKQL